MKVSLSSVCFVLGMYLILCVCCIRPSSGLYFHMKPNSQKCFLEEVPKETNVEGKYQIEMQNEGSDSWHEAKDETAIHVIVKDPNNDDVMSKDYHGKGKFTFISEHAGEFIICLSTKTTKWFGAYNMRVHFDLSVGEGTNDYAEIKKEEKLSEIQLRIRQLLDQVDGIIKEQDYQRVREARFRNTSESTNARVLWWSIAQTAILVCTGYWQLRHLKGFFEAKKLV
eukprot:Nk52_evm20s292 gene=Nk52_evmTU20s292